MADAVKQQHENLIRNTVRRLVTGLVTGRFFLTQILTQNRKFRYGRSSTKGKNHCEYPDRTAPNGRFSAEKTPRPILLSSRSGVRVPSGVPLFTSGGFSKLNMVDIAQLVSASDCGSEGRGFESHYPPHKVPISS